MWFSLRGNIGRGRHSSVHKHWNRLCFLTDKHHHLTLCARLSSFKPLNNSTPRHHICIYTYNTLNNISIQNTYIHLLIVLLQNRPSTFLPFPPPQNSLSLRANVLRSLKLAPAARWSIEKKKKKRSFVSQRVCRRNAKKEREREWNGGGAPTIGPFRAALTFAGGANSRLPFRGETARTTPVGGSGGRRRKTRPPEKTRHDIHLKVRHCHSVKIHTNNKHGCSVLPGVKRVFVRIKGGGVRPSGWPLTPPPLTPTHGGQAGFSAAVHLGKQPYGKPGREDLFRRDDTD